MKLYYRPPITKSWIIIHIILFPRQSMYISTHYCILVQSLLVQHSCEAQTGVGKISRVTPHSTWSFQSVELTVACHGLDEWKATNHCMCCALLCNNWWKEMKGAECPKRFDKFLIGDQLIPNTNNLSVIWTNHYVNYICSGNFSVSFIHSVITIKYCMKWTTAVTNQQCKIL